MAIRLDHPEALQPVDDFITHRRHRLREALQRGYVLEGLGAGNKRPLAMDPEQQTLFLKVAEGLPDRDPADFEHRAELMLRRHLAVRRVGAVEDACAQHLL